jgi:hypothetical protein
MPDGLVRFRYDGSDPISALHCYTNFYCALIRTVGAFSAFACLASVSAFAQQPNPAANPQAEVRSKSAMENCPMRAEHMKAAAAESAQKSGDEHHAAVNERGDRAMGFSHLKTTHHFRLSADGGAIEVVANAAQDAASLGQIRRHLAQIANQFSSGDFTLPQRIHAQTPPGVLALKRLKARIKYQYGDTENSGRVRLTGGSQQAREAILRFLRFQISDHQTGDSGKLERI